jgi:hypothetical protein
MFHWRADSVLPSGCEMMGAEEEMAACGAGGKIVHAADQDNGLFLFGGGAWKGPNGELQGEPESRVGRPLAQTDRVVCSNDG